MSMEKQVSILKARRTQRSLSISQLCPQYPKYESGQIPLGRAHCMTGYSIITDLGLTMEDLEQIIVEHPS